MCWVRPITGYVYSASDNKTKSLYNILDGKISAINITDGLNEWETEVGGRIISEPYVSGGKVYIASIEIETETEAVEKSQKTENERAENKSFTLRALSHSTGVVEWQTKIPLEKDERLPQKLYLHKYGGDLFMVSWAGVLYRLRLSDGKITERKTLSAEVSASPIFNSRVIIVATSDRRLVLAPLNDFPKIFTTQVSAKITAMTESRDGSLIWGDERGFVFSANVGTEKNTGTDLGLQEIKRKQRNGGEISEIVNTESGFLIASLDNYLYGVSKQGGKLLWKKRLANRLAFKPAIRDEYAVITTVSDSAALFIETKSGKTVNKIVLEEGNFFTDAPQETSGIFVFPTFTGLLAYTAGACDSKNKEDSESKTVKMRN